MSEPSWTERIRQRRELAAQARDADAPPADGACAHQPYPYVHFGKPTREVFFDPVTKRPACALPRRLPQPGRARGPASEARPLASVSNR